jgi:hypothetical protein
MVKSALARGEIRASSSFWISRDPFSRTGPPGRNFRVAGFGVASVCINIVSSRIIRFKAGDGIAA